MPSHPVGLPPGRNECEQLPFFSGGALIGPSGPVAAPPPAAPPPRSKSLQSERHRTQAWTRPSISGASYAEPGPVPHGALRVHWSPGSSCSVSHCLLAHSGDTPEAGAGSRAQESPTTPLEPHLTTIPSLFQRSLYVEVPGNHYVHINQPERVAGAISSFLKSEDRLPAKL